MIVPYKTPKHTFVVPNLMMVSMLLVFLPRYRFVKETILLLRRRRRPHSYLRILLFPQVLAMMMMFHHCQQPYPFHSPCRRSSCCHHYSLWTCWWCRPPPLLVRLVLVLALLPFDVFPILPIPTWLDVLPLLVVVVESRTRLPLIQIQTRLHHYLSWQLERQDHPPYRYYDDATNVSYFLHLAYQFVLDNHHLFHYQCEPHTQPYHYYFPYCCCHPYPYQPHFRTTMTTSPPLS
mmetsp:Transcript_24889/g.34784  ORF Transcript_24889/g.34784 Transcript_24889/m.34784 type:complete len:234 (-) Transcript_24889:832-1533(-)